MGLHDLTLPTAQVELSDAASFGVRGISFSDAIALYYRHTGELSALYEHFKSKSESGAQFDATDVSAIGGTLIANAALLVAEVIALASGTQIATVDFDKAVEIAKSLPAGVQMDALQKIGGLTFTSEMPPGKFFAVVLEMIQTTTAAISPSRRP